MVVGGPYSGGQSHHRHPLFRTCRMPLITRLSSTRSLPRTSLGKCGSIRHHCSSLSQNKLPRIFPLQNHQSRESATNSHIKTFISSNPSHSKNCLFVGDRNILVAIVALSLRSENKEAPFGSAF